MRVTLISGTREGCDPLWVHGVLERMRPDFVVHGGARGVDTQADTAARLLGIQPVRVDALWDFYGPSVAGPKRNGLMTSMCEAWQRAGWYVDLHAFPKGTSSGTRGTIALCHAAKILTCVYEVPRDAFVYAEKAKGR